MEPATRRRLEHATYLLLWAGGAATVLGALALLLPFPRLHPYGAWGLTFGLLGLATAIATAHPLDTSHAVRANRSGGASYERLRHWNRLRTASLLLQALALGGAVVVVLSLLLRADLLQAHVDPVILDRGAVVLIAAMAVTHALAQTYALRFHIERDHSGIRLAILVMALLLAATSAVRVAMATSGEDPLVALRADASPAAIVALGGHVVAAYALFLSRGLPTFAILFAEDRGPDTSDAARRRQAFLPAITAFGLLLVVFLLFILFGVGVLDVLDNVVRSPVTFASLIFLVVAIVASLAAAALLARNAERQANSLWRTPQNPRERRQAVFLVAGATAGGILLALALVAWQGWLGWLGLSESLWVHFLCLGILVAVGPYGFYMAREHKRVLLLEERFPDLLRDIASSHTGGLTLAEATAVAARGEYGPLTPEIRKMADQISWNVSFSEALVRFGDRVQTPLVERAVSLILEANRSGGNTTDVLIAAARDAREIKNLENERRLSMSLYTVVVYITFFVFLGVAAVLYSQFVPAMVASSQAAQSSTLAGAGAVGFGSEPLRLKDFQLFYFMAAVMQGLGDGIVAGVMGTGRAVLGLRHAFVMVAASYLTFTLFLV